MKTISATEAARSFSEILDRVRHHHESFVIVRRGEPVAQLEAVRSTPKSPTLADLLRKAVQARTGDPDFANDLESIQRDQPSAGEGSWPS